MAGGMARKARHTKRSAHETMRALARDETVGRFVHRLRGRGISDAGIGRLLGFPASVEAGSLRRTLNRWEREEGRRTQIDSQARADVTHAEKRVGEACRDMARVMPSYVDVVHFTLEAALEPKAARAVLTYLSELVGLLEAEIRANVLRLPREVMPGARPVAWDEVRERIAALQRALDEEKRRQIVAEVLS